MADPINLRLARKARNRLAAETAAAESRVRHGQTKAEKARLKSDAERAARLIEAARRDRPD